MKRFLFVFIYLFFSNCLPKEEFSNVPSISFEKLEYIKSSNNINQDSINLTISFTDGDGDLGLSNDDINFPYNPYDAIIDENLNWVTLGSTNVTPPLYLYKPNGSYSLFSNEDSRPSFSCQDYIIDTVFQTTELDTFYIQKNENNKNIFVEYYIKNGENYKFIDWKKIFDKEYSCGLDFDSRFPPLNISSNSQSITGNLTYSMVSYGFKSILENETFKLKIKIKDRGLNNSNIIETQDFTLTSILKEN